MAIRPKTAGETVDRLTSLYAAMHDLQQRSTAAQQRWNELRQQTEEAFQEVIRTQGEVARNLVALEEARLAVITFAAVQKTAPIITAMDA